MTAESRGIRITRGAASAMILIGVFFSLMAPAAAQQIPRGRRTRRSGRNDRGLPKSNDFNRRCRYTGG